MKKFLLPENAKFYKANLHNHTTLSDGKKTPEQIKKDYLEHGYSIVAFTDHDKYYCHNDLTDNKFLALNGFELEYYVKPWTQQTCHLCFIAKDKDNKALGFSSSEPPIFLRELPEGGLNPEEGGQLYKVTCPGRKYTPEYINGDIKAAKDLGFFVTYNHPAWSLESYPEYTRYENIDAMEMSNYGCVVEGHEDDNGRVYDDLLNTGHKIFCIATDDNHNGHPDEDPYSDSYGGYIQLAAEKLEYGSVVKAIEDGAFYSCAKVNPAAGECPEIKSLFIEDGFVHIETSPCANVMMIKDKRPFGRVIAGEGETITEADFKVGDCKWVRFVVQNANGNKAYTNAYFINNT